MKRLMKKANKLDDVKEALENYGNGDFYVAETKDGLSAEGIISMFMREYYTNRPIEIDSLHTKIIINEDNTVREFINLNNKWYEEKSDITQLLNDLKTNNLFQNNDEIASVLADIAYQDFI